MPKHPHHPYCRFQDWMVEHYGHALHRIPIDTGAGCPNRAEDGSGGCTFCPEHGARAVQTLQADSIREQVHMAMDFSRRRYGARHFMAYFQAFTPTFAPGSELRDLAMNLLQDPRFEAVSIGTRPDCISSILPFLDELRAGTDVWIELGIQSGRDETLRRINRGHTWADSAAAIQTLHDHRIHVAAHVILGLPGETPADFRATAAALSALPVDAVKIHNLHVLAGTALARQYESTPFPVWNEHEYAEVLIDFLQHLRPDIAIMRVCTDSLDAEQIAPRWELSKGEFVEMIEQQMACRCVRQGDAITPAGARDTPALQDSQTEDGSTTFWSDDYKEYFHAREGARLEAQVKFAEPSGLRNDLSDRNIQLLDICFGLGYNSLAACETARAVSRGTLTIDALEMDRRVVRQAASALAHASETLDWTKHLRALDETSLTESERFEIRMHWGDVRYTLSRLPDGHFDIVFHDPFSTQRNAELWTVEFFKLARRKMKPTGILLTYSNTVPVLAGLLEAGFHVGIIDHPRQRSSVTASPDPSRVTHPIPDDIMNLVRNSPRGTPYRDPHLVWTNSRILQHRQEQMHRSD